MIYNTFSERQRVAAGEHEVFQYEEVPQRLRVQVQQILRDALGPHVRVGSYDMDAPSHNPDMWRSIHKVLCKEFGLHSIGEGETAGKRVINFLSTCNALQFVDVVELCARMIDRGVREWSDYNRSSHGIEQAPDEALAELNYRFRQTGFGFQYEDGQFFRTDSEFIHQEIVKPALRILASADLEGARDEFLSAHRHFRNGDYEESISEAGKSFESMLKGICDRHDWTYAAGSRASDLLKVVRSKGLWPQYLDNSFDQLLATLASGLPKVRNEVGAHGQGAKIRSTPGYVAAYALHLAATKIVFIAEASNELSKQRDAAA